MKNRWSLILLGFLTVLLFSASVCLAQYIPNAPFKPVYPLAPDFTLKDLKGKTFRMADQLGKPVLIFFGTTWCPYCRKEIPNYNKILETYSPRGLVVVYINIMEPLAKVKRFAETNGMAFRVLLDEDGSVGTAYNAVGVPSIILVDREGRIIRQGHASAEMPIEEALSQK